MKRAHRSLQHHVLYRKCNGQDSEISALLGKCGFKVHAPALGRAGPPPRDPAPTLCHAAAQPPAPHVSFPPPGPAGSPPRGGGVCPGSAPFPPPAGGRARPARGGGCVWFFF